MTVKKDEHKIQDEICKFLRGEGWVTINCDTMTALKFLRPNDPKRFRFISHSKAQGYTKGQGDLVVHKDGVTLFLEVKTEIGVQSCEQKTFAKKVSPYHLVRSKEDVENDPSARSAKLRVLEAV